ncbi:MAG: class 1 isoprenoid biosynthesis enzyme [Microscillaceae bacterium]|nr:class 1 isoprenoid biosynthesis enzyme [Microscillaceae bacterium]
MSVVLGSWSHFLSHLLPKMAILAQKFARQQGFNAQYLRRYRLWPRPDASFGARELRRMQDYALQFVVFFAEVVSVWRGSPLRDRERERLTAFAAMLCLYDDFFDQPHRSEAEIWAFIAQPEQFRARNAREAVALALWQRLKADLPHPAAFYPAFQEFHQAQVASQAQAGGHHLPRAQIQKISFDKGGQALVLSWLLLDHARLLQEQAAVYQLGAWFQILDDIVDVAKDHAEGIATLVTTAPTLEAVQEDLEAQTRVAFSALQGLPYPAERLRQARDFSWSSAQVARPTCNFSNPNKPYLLSNPMPSPLTCWPGMSAAGKTSGTV